jgi:hypothetical protein
MPSLFPIFCSRPASRRSRVSGSLTLLAIALLAGPLSNSACAATSTASILVSTNVEPGCQVSSMSSPAANSWNAPVSMNCSLPAAYVVETSSGSRAELAGLSPASPAIVPAYASSIARNSPSPEAQSMQAANDNDHGLGSLIASLEETSSTQSDPAAITVTIVY